MVYSYLFPICYLEHLGCVHTNRVQSSPIQSSHSQSRGSDSVAYLQWQPRLAYTLAESSRVESHESCRGGPRWHSG